jgi:hypothetical protein
MNIYSIRDKQEQKDYQQNHDMALSYTRYQTTIVYVLLVTLVKYGKQQRRSIQARNMGCSQSKAESDIFPCVMECLNPVSLFYSM